MQELNFYKKKIQFLKNSYLKTLTEIPKKIKRMLNKLKLENIKIDLLKRTKLI